MLKIGIIGTGNIAQTHIEAYLAFPELCEIVALCDIVPAKAEERKQRYGLKSATVYPAHTDLLGLGLDLVSVCTPPSCHASITIDCLGAGINVLCEKPMAPSLEECDAMLAAEKASGKLLATVAQNRFRDDMAMLKEALDSGLVGPVSLLTVDSAWWRGRSYYDLWWRGTWESEGGGCTLNHAVHHIDLTLWLMGRPQAITAVMTNAQHDNSEVEDLSVAIWTYERALAQITSSVVSHGEEQSIVVQGRDARVSQPWKVIADAAKPNGFRADGGNPEKVAQLEALGAAHQPLAHIGHAGQIGDILQALGEGRRPLIDGHDGRNTIEAITAIYESAIEHRSVALPLEAADPYYQAGYLTSHAPHFFDKENSVADLEGTISL